MSTFKVQLKKSKEAPLKDFRIPFGGGGRD